MQAGDIDCTKPGPGRLTGLDILRLLAAGAVLLFHFAYAGTLRAGTGIDIPLLASVSKYGFLGVDLFFLISGFVIAASTANRSALQFAGARLLRLYPGHVACMTLTAVVVAIAGGEVTVGQWAANLTMLAPVFGERFMDGVYWSIVLEIAFYGWVALLVATGLWHRHLLAVIAAWLLIAFANEITLQWRPARLLLLTEYAGLFAGGILIHRLRQGERSLIAFALLGFAVSLGLIHAIEHQQALARLYGEVLPLWHLLAAHVAIYAVFLAALHLSDRIASTTTLTTLGGITYPLYLLHQEAGYLVLKALGPLIGDAGALTLTIVAAVALAWVVYAWIEPAGRRVLNSAAARLGRSAVAAPPASSSAA